MYLFQDPTTFFYCYPLEVENRLSEIDIDAVMYAGYLQQFIEDNLFSPFPPIHRKNRR
ncbi:spore germination protein [Neobacillus drentensis]|uniref:spore germination protein n=1 Tax=Neobacillus drentensis TaxID=220684 RepID=UPI003B58B25C